MKSTPITRKFDGKIYHLAVLCVTKATAQKEAKKLRKRYGSLVRIVRDTAGDRWNVYSRHMN